MQMTLITYPDADGMLVPSANRLSPLFAPQLDALRNRFPVILMCAFLLGMQLNLMVTNRTLSAVRVDVTQSGIKYPSSFFCSKIHPLHLQISHPSLVPQALPFMCLSSADSLHPLLYFRPSLSPLSHSLPHSIGSSSSFFPPPSFQPCQFLPLCFCPWLILPITPSVLLSLLPLHLILILFTFILSSISCMTSVYSSLLVSDLFLTYASCLTPHLFFVPFWACHLFVLALPL